MAKYLSNRQKNLKVGIVSYTENQQVLEVTGRVGIGTTNATADLDVNGNIRIRGAIFDNNNNSGQDAYVEAMELDGRPVIYGKGRVARIVSAATCKTCWTLLEALYVS